MSGDLSSFVLDSLRGLPEILQYHAGDRRRKEMNERTEALSAEEGKMKKYSCDEQYDMGGGFSYAFYLCLAVSARNSRV